jgi:hypothetical protein
MHSNLVARKSVKPPASVAPFLHSVHETAAAERDSLRQEFNLSTFNIPAKKQVQPVGKREIVKDFLW